MPRPISASSTRNSKPARRITDIRFRVFANAPLPSLPAGAGESAATAKLVRQMEAHGVGSAEAARLLRDYDTERIRWHLGELERRLRGPQQIASPAAWLVQGIRDDYRPQLSIFAQEEKERRAAAAAQLQRSEELQEALTRISKRYRQYLLPVLEAFLADLQARSAAEYALLAEEFQASLHSGFAREQFAAHGWSEPLLFNDVAAFFCRRYPAAFSSRAAWAEQEGLGDPDALAAELARCKPQRNRPCAPAGTGEWRPPAFRRRPSRPGNLSALDQPRRPQKPQLRSGNIIRIADGLRHGHRPRAGEGKATCPLKPLASRPLLLTDQRRHWPRNLRLQSLQWGELFRRTGGKS